MLLHKTIIVPLYKYYMVSVSVLLWMKLNVDKMDNSTLSTSKKGYLEN